jgi:hypothetical protein
MKLLKVLVAALLLAAMVVPAMAEDRLKLSGEMRVRAFHTDFDYDNDNDNSTDTWANQRLRIAGQIAVAEGVSVTFRTDITEGTNWGDSSSFGSAVGNPERSNGFGHARSGSQQQWDRAHLDLTKGMFHLRAGQQFVGTGGTWAVDTQDSGLALDIKTAMPINVFFIIDKDGSAAAVPNYALNPTTGAIVGSPTTGSAADNGTGNSDAYLYGASVSPKGDNYSAKIFYAGYSYSDTDTSEYLIGLSGSTTLGPVKLFAEFDHFDGEVSKTVDAMGDQLFVDASMAATDAITVGGQFFYADGDDKDKQLTRLGNGFNGWDPIFDVGTSLSNEEIGFGSPFNVAENSSANSGYNFSVASAGAVGARLYSSFKMNDALTFGASIAYLTEQEDKVVENEVVALAAGMVYKIMDNTTFQLQLQYSDGTASYTDAAGVKLVDDLDYDSFRAGTGIFVSF